MTADDGTARSSAFLRFGFGFFFLAVLLAVGMVLWLLDAFGDDDESSTDPSSTTTTDPEEEVAEDDEVEAPGEAGFALGVIAGAASPTAEVDCSISSRLDKDVAKAWIRREKKAMVLDEEGHDHYGVEGVIPEVVGDLTNTPADFDSYSWPNIDIVWDHTIGLLSFHEEAEPGFGLNIWLGGLVDGGCALRIVDASYATHKTYTGEDVHTYVFDDSGGGCGSPKVQNLKMTNQKFVGDIQCLSMVEVDVFGKVGATIKIEGPFVAVCRTCPG